MYPDQPNQPQDGMPPQVPPQTPPQPNPGYGAPGQPAMPQPAPGYNPSTTPQQPQPYPQPVAPQAPYPQQQPPSQATPPAGWYTPPPKPEDDKPASVDAYLHRDQSQNPAGGAPGQTVNGQYSIDYLNNISAPAKQPIDMKFIYVGVGAVVAILIALGLIAMQPKAAPVGKNEALLYATFIDTSDVTKNAGKNIQSSKLVAINSSLNGQLLNATTQMQQPLTDIGQDPAKLKTAAKKSPYHDQKLVTTLEDARLNAIYDKVYTREMGYKVRNIVLLMEKIKKTNKRKTMQAFIDQNEPSMKVLDKSFDDYAKSDEAKLY